MKRYLNNPIITREDIPEVIPDLVDVTAVFNPGAIMYNGRYLLLLRVQNRGRETFFLKAESSDGMNFDISDEIIEFRGIESVEEKVYHIYDPRITKINDMFYVMFAMDMEQECRLGLAKTSDFKEYDFMGIVSEDDNRNGVLFPEKINGKYMRLDRPNTVSADQGLPESSMICLSESDNLLKWSSAGKIIEGRFHYWDEKIGAGPPPIKTRAGWLQLYHGIAFHLSSIQIYQAGVMILDLSDPLKVLARGKYNILEPRELYELAGQVPNVVFPSGIIVEQYDKEGFAEPESNVNVYYGAADTVVGLVTATVAELIDAAKEA
jgi:beta-1,4-mannooligosaccharide/beta-1,4-mannosyl-N-acetylglucosamine phosphorylase